MDLPSSIPNSMNCPSCMPAGLSWNEQLAKLEWQMYKSGYSYLVYYCDNCKNGWTTTESDEISLKFRNNKKRSEKRKYKIKKIDGTKV